MKKYLLLIFFLNMILSNEVQSGTGSPIEGAGRIDIYGDWGGLNTTDSPALIADNEATDLQNVYFFGKKLIKRTGYSLFDNDSLSTPSLVTGLVEFTSAAGDTFQLACAGDSIKYISGGDWLVATDALTAGNIFDIAIGDDYIVFTNNQDRIQKWGAIGSTSDIIPFAGFEKARCVAYHQGYLFLANVEVSAVRYTSRLYYSTQGDITAWNAADYLNINENDGQPITGLAVDGYGNLLIFKSDSSWKLSAGGGFSPDTWRLSKISSTIGCVSTYSITNIENELIWLARNGVYGWTGGSLIHLSEKLQPTIDGLNQARLSYAAGGSLAALNQYWLSVSNGSSSTNDLTLVYNYKTGAWMKDTGINASYFATWLVSNTPTLISGNYSGYVFNQNTGDTDNGAAIDAYYDTKWFNFGNPINKKLVRRLTTIVDSQGDYNIDGYMYSDFKDEGVVASPPSVYAFPISLNSGAYQYDKGHQYDTGLQYTSQTRLIREYNIDKGAYWMKLRFRNTNANEPFTIHGFSLEGSVE